MSTLRLIGVFVGEWPDGEIYTVFYAQDGHEYLSKRLEEGWHIVSIKEPDGTELVLATPVEAPDPTDVMYGLLSEDDPQIVI